MYCGSGDPPLSQKGVEETKRIAAHIRTFAPDDVYSSDRRRAVQTARIVVPRHEVKTSAALREMDFGCFEGLCADEIERHMPQKWREYIEEPLSFAFPDGDSVPRFMAAAFGAVLDIVKRHSGRRVLIVTHKGVIMAALSYLLHGDGSHALHYDVRPSGYAKLDIYDGFAVLTRLYG